MINSRKIVFVLAFLLVSALGFTQDKNPRGYRVEMADLMRSNGRIYVVVAVVVTILAGLILYVYRLDRKISRMEKNH
jgi:multisubunit Na+/H+ antiporter MnhB subunit